MGSSPDLEEQAVAKLGRNWFNSFLKRRSEDLSYRLPVPQEPERFAVAADDVRGFYDSLQLLMEERRIHPALMANVDETMLKAIRKWRKVVTRAEDPRPFVAMDDKVMHITLLPTVFANGDSLIPLVIVPVKHVPADLPDATLSSFHWSGQSSGWIDKQTFHRFITKVFIPSVIERRRQFQLEGRWALLLTDGHNSRENPVMLQECFDNQIEVKSSVAHASHMMQTLDRGVFRMFKTTLTSLKSTASYSNRSEWRKQMLRHSASAMATACERSVVLEAWREAGCWPVDSSKALNKKNFPDLDLPPLEESIPAKRKRSSFNISNQLLTSAENIEKLRERDLETASKRSKH